MQNFFFFPVFGKMFIGEIRLIRIKIIKRNYGGKKSYFQARYVDSDTGKVLKSFSIEELRKRLGEGSTRQITNRQAAILIAQRALDEDVVFSSDKEKEIAQYIQDFWDYDSSAYIKLKNSYQEYSVTRNYARNMLGFFHKHVLPKLPEGMRLSELTSAFFNKKILLPLIEGKTLKNATLNNIIKSVRVPVTYAFEKEHILKNNPMAEVNYLPPNSEERGILTDEENEMLFNYLWNGFSNKTIDIKIWMVIKFAVKTGTRMSEARGLKKDKIVIVQEPDGTERAYAIISEGYVERDKQKKTTKDKKVRKVPLTVEFAKQLIALADMNPWGNGYVFWSPRTSDAPVSSSYVREHFYDAMRAIGISEEERKKRNLVFHSTRHFLNTLLLDHFLPEQVNLVIGHSDLRMAQHYNHETMKRLFSIGDVVSSSIKSPDETS